MCRLYDLMRGMSWDVRGLPYNSCTSQRKL